MPSGPRGAETARGEDPGPRRRGAPRRDARGPRRDGRTVPRGARPHRADGALGEPAASTTERPFSGRSISSAPTPAPNAPGPRERARAGILRMQFRDRPSSLAGLLQEANAWFGLLETAEDPAVLRWPPSAPASPRWRSAGTSSPSAGPTSSRSSSARLSAASVRVQTFAPGAPDGRRLASRASILLAMRGDGSPAVPQEVKRRVGGPRADRADRRQARRPAAFRRNARRRDARRPAPEGGGPDPAGARAPCGSLPTAGRSPGSKWPDPRSSFRS